MIKNERSGVAEGTERNWCYFRFLSGRKRITDGASATIISVPHFVGGLGKLVPTGVGSDEGPATGANSISGRAVSGSGLGAAPGLSG